MFSQVLRFVRLPLLLILIYAVMRLIIGLNGVPYAPRGNAVFSVVGLTIISSLYFGALSRKVGGFGWLGTVLVGFIIALWAQILIFTLTLISYSAHLNNSYYLHWDSLGFKEPMPVTMNQLLAIRGGGLVVNIILGIVAALLGRALFGMLAPTPRSE
ncbi:MAG: hypothetical protein ACJ74W_16655 [Pyrinomonadaceae bacterium]